jgi:hypothetical protein
MKEDSSPMFEIPSYTKDENSNCAVKEDEDDQ